MNKKEQLKKLTWKYFWKQKAEEVVETDLFLVALDNAVDKEMKENW